MTNGSSVIFIPSIGPYHWTVEALAREVRSAQADGHFRMAGFFGPWGSGKTTLLREVERRVGELAATTSSRAKLELFDAWQSRDDENLPVSILAHLIEPDHRKDWFEALDQSGFKSARSKILTSLSTLMRTVTGNGVTEAVADQIAAAQVVWGASSVLVLHASERQKRAQLNDVLGEIEIAILDARGLRPQDSLTIAVDNLDRCSPDRLVSVLEALHNFSGLSRVRFLLVGDEAAIIESVRSRYPTLDADGARAYVEKVISPIFRMPVLGGDPEGLQQVLSALGLSDSVKSVKAASGLDISDDFLFQMSRFALQGNPRKALHMFRSLPSYAGQWNHGTRKQEVVGCGAQGIAARWIMETYCPEFLRDVVAMPARLQSEVANIDLEQKQWQFDEEVRSTLRRLFGNVPPTQGYDPYGAKARLGAATLLVCRGRIVDKSGADTKWPAFVTSFVKL